MTLTARAAFYSCACLRCLGFRAQGSSAHVHAEAQAHMQTCPGPIAEVDLHAQGVIPLVVIQNGFRISYLPKS